MSRKNNAILKVMFGFIIFAIFVAVIIWQLFYYSDIAYNAPGGWILGQGR